MFAIKDLLALLEEWPKWKRIRETPDNLEALAARVSELEKKLARCPGDGCPKCGELAFRVESSAPDGIFGDVGATKRTMKCEKCGYSESKLTH